MNIKNILGCLLLIAIPFLLLELAFRALPVAYPPYILPVSSSDPIAHFQPNRHYTFSKGWNFAIKADKYSNNYGYINENDYIANDRSPLLMIIGDSFVEAHQVDAGHSAAELLHSRVESYGRVYSIGLSGAALSQYLAFAEYSKLTFNPKSMAFIIVGNDFDGSLLKYGAADRFHLFKEKNNGLILERNNYHISSTKKLLRKSAFFRYIMLNLEVKQSLDRILSGTQIQPSEYIGNVPVTVSKERIDDSMKAIDEFFNQLPLRSGLNSTEILFIMDGMRPALYSQEILDKSENSYFSQMRQYFETQGLAHGYEVIDMQETFINRNRLDGSRFEFETDGHWNELGHSLVAEKIEESGTFKSTFQK